MNKKIEKDIKKHAKQVEVDVNEEQQKEVAEKMRGNIKLLLQLNINNKKLCAMFTNDIKVINRINESISNSEYGLKKIDSIQNDEIILDFYSNLQKNFGVYLETTLSIISGTFGSNKIYEDDTQFTLFKQKQEVTDNEGQVQ